MFLLAISELYSFLVSIPQEKSDKVSWTIFQNFCSCYPFGPEKLAKIQGVWTVPKKRNWCRNQYFSQNNFVHLQGMDWPSFPKEKKNSYSPHQCPPKLPPCEDSLQAFQGCATSCLLVSAPFPSIPRKGTCCRGITRNRSQANRRTKLTQSCQTCVAHELIRFAEGSACKCKPSTICRKLICLGDIVYDLHKPTPCIVWLDHWVTVGDI